MNATKITLNEVGNYYVDFDSFDFISLDKKLNDLGVSIDYVDSGKILIEAISNGIEIELQDIYRIYNNNQEVLDITEGIFEITLEFLKTRETVEIKKKI